MTIKSLAAGQGPAGSSVVKVRVTEPAVISAGVGVYVAFRPASAGLDTGYKCKEVRIQQVFHDHTRGVQRTCIGDRDSENNILA